MSKEEIPQVGAGDVAIMLGGKEQLLRPSLTAITTLSKANGGLVNSINQCSQWNFETICFVVQTGLGLKNVKEIRELPQLIYDAGLSDTTGGITNKCVEYLHNLARGGRPLPPVVGEGDNAEDPPQND